MSAFVDSVTRGTGALPGYYDNSTYAPGFISQGGSTNPASATTSAAGLGSATPSSQKADVRPISFVLDNGTTKAKPNTITLYVRPEDLNWPDPSRLTVQQTLGGAWGDSFGEGIANVTINGHTGWRGDSSGSDGLQRFIDLRAQVFKNWHAQRATAVQAGQDPSLVKLIFADALDQRVAVMAPLSFTLRRSRSRPLLAMYSISMLVLTDQLSQPETDALAPVYDLTGTKAAAGQTSLLSSANNLQAFAGQSPQFLSAPALGPATGFMSMSSGLFGTVASAAQQGSAFLSPLLSVASQVAGAGLAGFRTLAGIVGQAQFVRAQLMEVASEYSNALCTLENAFSSLLNWQDFSGLFGASNCSSTSGGRPISAYAGQNPFASLFPAQPGLPVSVNAGALVALTSLRSSDPVLLPQSPTAITANFQAINAGVTYQ